MEHSAELSTVMEKLSMGSPVKDITVKDLNAAAAAIGVAKVGKKSPAATGDNGGMTKTDVLREIKEQMGDEPAATPSRRRTGATPPISPAPASATSSLSHAGMAARCAVMESKLDALMQEHANLKQQHTTLKETIRLAGLQQDGLTEQVSAVAAKFPLLSRRIDTIEDKLDGNWDMCDTCGRNAVCEWLGGVECETCHNEH